MMTLGDCYVTRNGMTAYLTGVSAYYENNNSSREVTIFTGRVNDELDGSWNAQGELLFSKLLGNTESDLDIVRPVHTPNTDGCVYYVESKKESKNARK